MGPAQEKNNAITFTIQHWTLVYGLQPFSERAQFAYIFKAEENLISIFNFTWKNCTSTWILFKRMLKDSGVFKYMY